MAKMQKRGADHTCSSLYYIVLFLQFPDIDLTGLFVQLQVAVIAGFFDLSVLQSGPDGAARFFAVGAVPELAVTEVPAKIREVIGGLMSPPYES